MAKYGEEMESPDIDSEAYEMKFNFLKQQYDLETQDWLQREQKLIQERQDLMTKNMELNE